MNPTLEHLYDKYSPTMYSVAMQITCSEDNAEHILMYCFKKINEENLVVPPGSHSPMAIIRLTVKAAYELFPERRGNHQPLKQFQRLPALNKLFCEDAGMENANPVHPVSQSNHIKNLRMEIALCSGIKR